MHHFQAIVVKRQSYGAESPTSTVHRTSGDIEIEFVRTGSSGSRSVRTGREHILLPSHEDPRTCLDPWHLGKSQWDKKLGKADCVFSLYDKMRWNEIMSHYPEVSQIYTPHCSVHLCCPCISVHPPSLNNDVLAGLVQASLNMHWEAAIE